MSRTVYSISIPFPVLISRRDHVWDRSYQQLLFKRMPSRRELLFLLHEKGDAAYQRSGNDNNLWWELIEVLSHIPTMKWFGVDGFEGLHLQSSNINFEHPILGIASVAFERLEIESLDEQVVESSFQASIG